MYKIVTLKENETPRKESKIFPEFEIKEATYSLKEYATTSDHDLMFVKRYDSLVPIVRNGVKWLIPFVQEFRQKLSEVTDESVGAFHGRCIKECEKIIEQYIVPNPDDYEEPTNGIYSRIYKYEK